MEQAVQINGYLCFTLGTCLNLILLYFIRRKTAGDLKSYTRILLQMTCIDLLLLITSVLTMPIVMISRGKSIFYDVGIVSYFPEPPSAVTFTLMASWHFAIIFAIYALPIQFVYRYHALCKGKILSRSTYASMILISTLLAMVGIGNMIAYSEGDLQSAREIFFPTSIRQEGLIMLYLDVVRPCD